MNKLYSTEVLFPHPIVRKHHYGHGLMQIYANKVT